MMTIARYRKIMSEMDAKHARYLHNKRMFAQHVTNGGMSELQFIDNIIRPFFRTRYGETNLCLNVSPRAFESARLSQLHPAQKDAVKIQHQSAYGELTLLKDEHLNEYEYRENI